MKSERSWAGIICGFVLFIVVCLSLLLHMKGAFRASGNPELGLLFFCCQGGGELPLSRTAGTASFAGCDAGGAGLYGDDAAVLRDAQNVLAGDGVGTERGVLVRARGVVLLFICAWRYLAQSLIEQIN